MATTQTLDNTQELMDTHMVDDAHGETHHEWPHIPLIQGEQVWWPISNVSITTMLFLLIVSIVTFFAKNALKKNKKSKKKASSAKS